MTRHCVGYPKSSARSTLPAASIISMWSGWPDRDGALKAVNARGIGAGVHYPFALHELEAYTSLGYRAGDFPTAENWARQCLSLPIYPELTAAQADFCVAAIEAAFAARGPQVNGSLA